MTITSALPKIQKGIHRYEEKTPKKTQEQMNYRKIIQRDLIEHHKGNKSDRNQYTLFNYNFY